MADYYGQTMILLRLLYLAAGTAIGFALSEVF